VFPEPEQTVRGQGQRFIRIKKYFTKFVTELITTMRFSQIPLFVKIRILNLFTHELFRSCQNPEVSEAIPSQRSRIRKAGLYPGMCQAGAICSKLSTLGFLSGTK
jgi:hypothetical protein